ncbi:hypothetical protein KAJ83_18465 [Marivibrio halodurans]|uniref:Uncharacterized protein n=1 Tax=Marivibrio halodurans TaxID=2039722 RepID=A0A8J7S2C1_9PROT|nr:hypothetical protein [Marivibrio halodurans]MBP5859010.1 hypothetical protein [Marivibrio halodurans]
MAKKKSDKGGAGKGGADKSGAEKGSAEKGSADKGGGDKAGAAGSDESRQTDPILRTPALAMRGFANEINRKLESAGTALARQDAAHLTSIEAYTMLLFMLEFSDAGLSEKHYRTLLAKYGVDTPANLKIYPMLSQTVLFELFQNLGISRESIRRLLILMAEHGLVDRVSKGPPFPDQLGLSKEGRKLMGRVAKKLAKDIGKTKPFGYL